MVQPMAGAQALLDAASGGGWVVGVVTSGNGLAARAWLDRVGLADRISGGRRPPMKAAWENPLPIPIWRPCRRPRAGRRFRWRWKIPSSGPPPPSPRDCAPMSSGRSLTTIPPGPMLPDSSTNSVPFPRCSPMLEVANLAAEVRLIEEPQPPAPTPAVVETIEDLWRTAAEDGIGLTDGRLFNIVRRSGADLAGHLVPFSWYWAQRCDPTLYDGLGITGLRRQWTPQVVRRIGLCLARRAAVSADAGLWELAPSGGVDDGCRGPDGALSPLLALLSELEGRTQRPAGSGFRGAAVRPCR